MGSKFRTSNAFGTPPMDTILVCTIFVYPHITLQEIAATTISDRFWLNACLLTLTIHHFDFRRQLADRFITVFMPSARHASRADHTTWSVLCHKTTGHHPTHHILSGFHPELLDLLVEQFGSPIGHIGHITFLRVQLAPIDPSWHSWHRPGMFRGSSIRHLQISDQGSLSGGFCRDCAQRSVRSTLKLRWAGCERAVGFGWGGSRFCEVRWKWESVESNPSSWSKFKVQWKCLRSMFPFMSSFQSFYFWKGFIS